MSSLGDAEKPRFLWRHKLSHELPALSMRPAMAILIQKTFPERVRVSFAQSEGHGKATEKRSLLEGA